MNIAYSRDEAVVGGAWSMEHFGRYRSSRGGLVIQYWMVLWIDSGERLPYTRMLRWIRIDNTH